MPWHIDSDSGSCPTSRPWAVVKDSDGEVEGCHTSKDAAENQMAALYAQEEALSMTSDRIATTAVESVEALGKPSPGTPKDGRLKENECPDGKRMLNGKCVPKYLAMALEDVPPEESHPVQPWFATMVVEGSETGDGREFALESLSWEDPATGLILLSWQPKDLPAHEEAVTVGRVNHIERIPLEGDKAKIDAWGVIDLGSEHGREFTRQVRGGYAGGLSVDVDSVANVEIVFPEEKPIEAADVDGVTPTFVVGEPEKKVFHKGRIRGVTACRLPALVEGRLQLLDVEEETLVSDDPIVLTEDTIVASSAVAVHPPSAWFRNPKLERATPFTVTEDGQVFGHMALWSTCHTTFPDRCITPPREREHAYYLRHELITAEGESVSVGPITLGVGHAEARLGAVPAAAHYDDPRLVVADVTTGEDKFGIWIAGALRPTATEEQLNTLKRGVSLSGDWRGIAGKLRLVAVLCVNSPGFPIPRMRAAMASEDGPWTTLVAAGIPTEEHIDMANAPYPPGTLVIKRRMMDETFIGNGNNQYTKGGRGRGAAKPPSGGAAGGKGGGGGGGGGRSGGGGGDGTFPDKSGGDRKISPVTGERKPLVSGAPIGGKNAKNAEVQKKLFKSRGDADKKNPDSPLSASKNADDLVKGGKATHGEAIESVAYDRGIGLKTETRNGKVNVRNGNEDDGADIGHYDPKTDKGTIYTTTVPYEVDGYKNFVNEAVHHPWNIDSDADVRPPEKKSRKK